MGVQRGWRGARFGLLATGLAVGLLGCSSSSNTGFAAGVRVDQMLVRDLDVRVDTTGAQLTWVTRDFVASQVRYGTTTALGATANGTAGTTHRVALTGLTPDTTYYFSFTGEAATFRFKTLGGTRSRLAFVGSRGSAMRQIYLCLDQGENVTAVTTAGGRDPAVSRDGTRLAFVAPGAGGRDNIWVATLDTNGLVAGSLANLTGSTTRDELHPSWSPDHSKIAFTVSGSGFPKLVVRDVPGGAETVLPVPGTVVDQPVFSPDGTKLAFTSNARSSIVQLAQRPVDPGSVQATVNDTYGSVLDPTLFSLYDATNGMVDLGGAGVNGLKVTFRYTVAGRAVSEAHVVPVAYINIFTCNLDGSALMQATNFQRRCYDPCWLPNGTDIAHTEEWGTASQLVLVDLGGTNRRALTSADAQDRSPAVSPDGSTLTFVTNRSVYGINNLWSMPVAGGAAYQIDLWSMGDSQAVWTVIP